MNKDDFDILVEDIVIIVVMGGILALPVILGLLAIIEPFIK